QDFGCELLDPHGNSLAHSPRSMPVFNLTLPRAVKEILKKYPAESLRPGDILCTNDPWICAGHLYDIAIVTPVFRTSRVVALDGTPPARVHGRVRHGRPRGAGGRHPGTGRAGDPGCDRAAAGRHLHERPLVRRHGRSAPDAGSDHGPWRRTDRRLGRRAAADG